VIVVLAVVFAGLGAALLMGGGASESDSAPTPTPSPSGAAPGAAEATSFELRQVYFQESGGIQRKPPLRPGPAKGGKDATGDLLRIDCDLQPRPTAPDDNVILCDSFGFRYGLGPSELSAGGVADAVALQGQASSDWTVQVTLTDEAAATFEDVTRRVSALGPPLNQLAIVLNDAVVTAPVVQEPIKGGVLQINGRFTQAEAEALATALG
jgi:preprotein translocase subunit SecD